MAAKAPHYTATVVVSLTTPEHVEFKDSYDKTGTVVAREVDEVARLVLRGEHLPTLIAETTEHLKLMVVE